MTPAAIIAQAAADGVRLGLSSVGTIKATGDQAAVSRWLPVLRDHKPAIVAALQKTGNETIFWRWLIHLAGRDLREVVFSPPVTRAEVVALYPDAVEVRPAPETPTRKPTAAEVAELTRLVTAVYVHANDTDADRADALARALADPDGALQCYRAIAAQRKIVADPEGR